MEENPKDKKKIWIIIGIVTAALVIALGTFLIIKAVNKDDGNNAEPTAQQRGEEGRETGSFYKMNYTDNGFLVEVDSKEPGHPSGDAKFETNLTYKTSDGGSEIYRIEYLEIKEYLNDVTTLGITINGKDYNYMIKEGDSSTTLTYVIPNTNRMALSIKVTGTALYGADGAQCKCLPIIDEEFLKSEELAGVLNYQVSMIEQ